ncbi:MAG: DEAD/DEAH box helicase family protein [Chloroflexi bacterium]|nr:DEAD/DEAH box helicase family protein [Chloroflexota bacterium]
MTEVDSRIRLLDPALHAAGWTEELIRREETPGAVEIVEGRPRRAGTGRTDYTLRIKLAPDAQAVAVAVVEAKRADAAPTRGLEQAKEYAREYARSAARLHVPFVYSTNGHLFVEFDATTHLTTAPAPMADFPSPNELRARWEAARGVDLTSELARPLSTPYRGGETSRRYYQDAAIRAVLEKVARGENRALLSLATGAGKTYIAVHLLRRLADAGLLRRALFLVDRDELRSQALGALQNVFGADAAAVSGGNAQPNARVLVATYQTLGLDRTNTAADAGADAEAEAGDEGEPAAPATFLEQHYPPDYFNIVIIDECHRSGWGDWSTVLTRNANAIQVGLTATPRQLTNALPTTTPGIAADAAITADNLRYFGDPVYEYELGRGIEDGYLAACEIVRRDIFLEGSPFAERETGLDRDDLAPLPLWDTMTGEQLAAAEARDHYGAPSFEDRLVLPDRVRAMADDLFDLLLATGGPEQKTIVYCARDSHADDVAIALNNRYAHWCAETNRKPADRYAFKCTAAVQGPDPLPELRGAARHHFVATTVELLTTGVDVPAVRNIVFFRYVRSPIAFYQMIGRGTRLHPASGKLMFRVFDYTAATRLFGEAFRTRATTERTEPTEPPTGEPPERRITVQGIDVRVSDAGKAILTTIDGATIPISLEEYEERLAERLVARAPSLDAFRAAWILPPKRAGLLAALPDGGRSAGVIRALEGMDDFDLYDVLAELGYGLDPKTRVARADAFDYKHTAWLAGLPPAMSATLRALARQFARGGTDELEQPGVLQVPAVVAAGGLAALKALGSPADILLETKSRLFAA